MALNFFGYNDKMIRLTPLATGEVYHVYNRGAHKQAIFTNDIDRDRFLLLLYIANGTEPIRLRNLLKEYQGRSSAGIYTEVPVEKTFVDLFAYSLMPNHFHLIMRQKVENGITAFMKRVATGYSMYFNTKYDHGGVLFQGRFQSRHVDTDEYFRYLFAYVHLNPVDLFQPGWKEHGIQEETMVREFMSKYRYSSYYDYSVGERPERAALSYAEAPEFVKQGNDLEDLLQWQNNLTQPRTVLGSVGGDSGSGVTKGGIEWV